MNTLYKLANLLDGDFDGRVIHFNRKRYYANLFVEYVTYSFLICHLIVFFRPAWKYDIGEYYSPNRHCPQNTVGQC